MKSSFGRGSFVWALVSERCFLELKKRKMEEYEMEN
jgi:hypothetical protein